MSLRRTCKKQYGAYPAIGNHLRVDQSDALFVTCFEELLRRARAKQERSGLPPLQRDLSTRIEDCRYAAAPAIGILYVQFQKFVALYGCRCGVAIL